MGRRFAGKDALRGTPFRALGWSFGSTLLNKVSLFGIGIMLARLLGPHAFGTYAVAYVALIAVLNFNELGVSLAIVRWQGDPGEIVPTVTTISLLVSAVIYAGCFFAAPVYATTMGAPAATTVIRVLALAVLSDGCTNTPAALLQRNFRQGQRTIADQVNVWLGTCVTVALAWTGHGAMSLAIGRVVGCVAGAMLLLAFAPESLRLGFNPAKARALLRFGLPLAGANLIAFAVMTVDQVVVGHVLGPVALGFYVLALNLAGWPIAMFSQPVRTVGPAVFARLQHDSAAMRTTFLSAAGLLCAVALPMCLLISGAARPLISFVYGTSWLPATQPLMWLALLAAIQVFFLLAYDFFVVLARSRFLLVTQLGWLLALVPALVVGARMDGIYGASLAEFAVAAFCILPWYLIKLSKAGIRLRALGRHVCLPFAGAALTGLLALVAAAMAPNDFTALAASGAAMAAVVGLLGYRMRTMIALLRSPSAELAAAGSADTATAAPTPDAKAPAGEFSQELSAIRGTIDAPIRHREMQQGLPATRDALLTRSARPGSTGPLPFYRDILSFPSSGQDPRVTSPLYRKTVASLQWDPAGTSYRERAPEPGNGRAGRVRLDGAAPDKSLGRHAIEPADDGAFVAFQPSVPDVLAIRTSALTGDHLVGHNLAAATAEVLHNLVQEEETS
jgi:O-antigen/teichoic acid export membrane protein